MKYIRDHSQSQVRSVFVKVTQTVKDAQEIEQESSRLYSRFGNSNDPSPSRQPHIVFYKRYKKKRQLELVDRIVFVYIQHFETSCERLS